MSLVSSFRKSFKDEIVRRVFIKNTFDGVITVLGILIAFFFADFTNPRIIILTCLGSGIAMCVSGIWGAYLTEATERGLRVKILEKHMLKSLEKTKIKERSRRLSIIVALFDGLSPLIATIIILVPFFTSSLIAIKTAYYSSFLIAAALIVFLGVLISRFGREPVLPSIAKMLAAGIILSIILYLVELIKLF